MANNETTTKFKVDISELKKAMQEAKQSVAVANSEFKEVASTMDDWSKSSKGISAKLKQLDSNLKNQKKILKSLEDQYELTVKEMGEGSKAANDLKIKINNQKAVVKQTEKEIGKYEKSLEEVTEAEKKAAKTGKSVADILDEIGDESKSAGDGFTVFKGAVASFIGSGLTSLVGGLRDAASSLLGLGDETREYRTEMAKLDAAFNSAGHTTKTATKTYQELNAVLGDTAKSTEAANHLAKLCKTEQELSQWTNIAAGVYATFGDSLPIEGLTEAANETAKTGALTGSLADALNWAGINEDEFNKSLEKCSTEQERQSLITKTLNGLYAKTGEEYKKNNANLLEANKSQERLTETYAEFGKIAEPIMSTIRDGVSKLLKAILELIKGADFKAVSKAVSDGFDYLIKTVLPEVKKGFKWILDNKDSLIAGLSGIAAGFVAFKVVTLLQGIVSAFKSWKVATEGMTVAQRLLNLVMAANPIALVTTLIAGLVAAFVVLWNKSESFRKFWINLWTKIKSTTNTVVTAISNFFTKTIPNAINKMVTFFSGLPSKISTWLNSALNNVVVWGNNLASKGKEAASKLINAVVTNISSLASKVASIGKDVVSGLWNGISDKVYWLKNKISGFVGNVKDWLKNFFKIGSPSKLMRDEIGRWIPEGIAVGIDKNAKSVMSSMKDLTANTLGATRDGLSANVGGGLTGCVVNNFTQVINSPKQLNRLDIYRQSKNLLGYAGGGY
jgi:phage-related protein